MEKLREFMVRVRNTFRPEPPDTEAELRFHVEMETEARVRRGVSAAEAARQARIHSGSVTGALESIRDQRGLPSLEGTIADLRQAAVSLARHPGFTAIAVIALALAVAMNTLIFTLIDGVLLKPLPYPHPERLVRVFGGSPRNPRFPLSIGAFLEFRRNSRTLESIALYTREDLQLMHGDQPERLPAVRVSADFFPTLGIAPMRGRNFTESETRGIRHVVILSSRLWKSRFHADPDIVGRQIRLNRENWTVVGVLPPGFQHVGGAYRSPLQGDTVALWWPQQLDLPEQAQRGWHFTNSVARLRPGVSLQQAQQDMDRLSAYLRVRFKDYDSNLEARVTQLAAEVTGQSRITVWLLAAAGGLVLLIACANVAGLCIARGLARRREIAVRKALGAGAWRLIRVVLCENAVLGGVGGIAGLLLAAALSPAWQRLLPADFPRVHEVKLTFAAALFAVVCAVVVSIVAGLVPALRQAGSDPVDHLNEQSRGASQGRRTSRFRALLVASEVAFAAILCASAVLLLHSSVRLNARSHGFDPRNALTFTLSLPEKDYAKPEQRNRFFSQVLAGWRALPGVRAAGFASNIPWTGYDENTSFGIPGVRNETDSGPQARFQMASAGYFEALRIPLRAGRYFDERDRPDSAPVVMVNESLARRFLPHRNPVGMTLDIWGTRRQIIGVVADIFDHPADPAAEPAFWFPLPQMPVGQLAAVLRTDSDSMALLREASRTVHEIDPELPVAESRSMAEVARIALGERNLANWLFQAFAALAVALAVFGIYGLLSYIVQQRYKEFGIRVALGATRGGVIWLVLRDGLLQAGGGALAGILLAPIAARSLASLLYGVTPLDPIPLLLAPAVILIVSISASLFPAMTAARAEPASTLRAE